MLRKDLLAFLDVCGMPTPRELLDDAKKVLIVDDDARFLRAMNRALTTLGPTLDVETCNSGVEALMRIGADPPDFVLLDILMPGVDGVELGTRVVVDPSLAYSWYDGVASGEKIASPEFRIIGEHTQGGFAEYCVVPAENLLEIPEGVEYQRAAAASLVSVTAWRGLMTRGCLRAGERVLVTGASGGVSTMAIQIARMAGAEVFAITSGPENAARVRELGAHVVYDRKEEDWGKQLYQDTKKAGVDLVFDSVGEAVWPQCLKALNVRGRLVTYGATTGAKGETEIRLVFWKQLSILGSTMGSPKEYRTVMDLVFQGVLNPVIHAAFPL